jgi:translocation and assembly module TamA
MIGRGQRLTTARLLCAAAAAALCPQLAAGQQNPALDPTELDPSAPLDPLPDLGVEWPDLESGSDVSELPIAQDVPATTALRYAVRVEGLAGIGRGEELLARFHEQSALAADRNGTANPAQVDRRLRDDVELLAELLRSQGYYDAKVEPQVETSGGVLNIAFAVEPSERYQFDSVELPGLAGAGPEAAALRDAFAVKAGDPVVAEEVIAGGLALKVALGEQGFALAEVGEQQIDIDHETRRASLILPVTPGPLASFGAILVSGSPGFSAEHVATIARFEAGEPFRRSRVDDLRRALIATGLVASADVRIVPGASPNTVNLAVRLEPAPPRTIAGELGYGTGEGLRAEASWQHRNFLTPEGAITIRGIAGTQEQLAGVQFRRSNFGRRDQILNLQASASHTDRDAYEAKTLLLAGNIERQSNIIWQKKWTWSVGAELLGTRERGAFDSSGVKQTRDFLIAAVPASLGYDSSNDLLDPTTGFRLTGRISPEVSAQDGSFAYGRVQLDASTYRPVTDTVVAAARVRVGTIVGADAFSIAPTRRFFAGGGGSVRGYGYQRLGPRDADGDPTGGRSLAEIALEARIRVGLFGGNFGIVPFLDGGVLSNDRVPDLRDWQFGAGVGLRYYSSFGPIRIDVGTPLNPREGDGPVAVTVSLGQAF